MANNFTAVDLAQLPAPSIVESLDFETILAAMLADLVARAPEFTALVESDPAYKVLEVCAYRELLMRQRVNEAAKGVMLAYAVGADLDQLAARYDVDRLLVAAGDASATPPTVDVYEDDESLRRRIQLAFEGFSTAGPEGGYIFHTLGASGDVLDAAANSPVPGAVNVAVLSRTGNGEASDALLAAVTAVFALDDVRPMTDLVTVQSADVVEYTVAATLKTFSGPDKDVVLASAQEAVEAYAAKQHRLGRDITLSGIYSALHRDGVQDVDLAQPAASVVCTWNQAPFCAGITLTYGGTGD